MESMNSRLPSKRFVFDRRYGWVLDEWKDPSEAALEGGRGMFCIVPLAKAFFRTASQSVNFVATSAVKALERPELFSPNELHARFRHQLNKFKSSIEKTEFCSLGIKGKSVLPATSSSSNLQTDNAKVA
ncbi:hypothetical protein SLE2022_116530 [Rubroshorea leprosula]